MEQTDISPLGISTLALLAEKPMHPYEAYQLLLDRRQNHMVKVRPGTLYHAIDRMAAAGYVAAAGTEREGNRPERTRYAITPAGRRALEARVVELLAAPVAEYPIFPVALGEVHLLGAELVVTLLRRRVEAMSRDRDQLDLVIALVANGIVEERFLLAPMHRAHQLSAEIDWITSLIARIESGDLNWGDAHAVAPHLAATHRD